MIDTHAHLLMFNEYAQQIISNMDNDDLQNKAMLMAKSVGGMVHSITKGTLIVVKH